MLVEDELREAAAPAAAASAVVPPPRSLPAERSAGASGGEVLLLLLLSMPAVVGVAIKPGDLCHGIRCLGEDLTPLPPLSLGASAGDAAVTFADVDIAGAAGAGAETLVGVITGTAAAAAAATATAPPSTGVVAPKRADDNFGLLAPVLEVAASGLGLVDRRQGICGCMVSWVSGAPPPRAAIVLYTHMQVL